MDIKSLETLKQLRDPDTSVTLIANLSEPLDLDVYCRHHPQMLNRNKEQIKLIMFSYTDKEGELKSYKRCPKCHLMIES